MVSRRTSSVLFFSALLGTLLSSGARATPNFPAALQRELSLEAAPACTLCHVGIPRVGTVTTPFATSMRARGLVFYDEEALAKALEALRADAVDSDGDGVTDLAELAAGGDPNVPAPKEGEVVEYLETFDEPRHGCGAAPGQAGGAGFSLLLLLAAVSSRGRGRR